MGRRARFVAIVVTLVAVAVALAGCGSSGGVSTASPAEVVPSGALVYVDVTVRPEGSQRTDAQSALTRLLGRNPIPQIQNAIERSAKTSGISYRRDIQPWLGQRIGLAVMGLSNANYALVAPTNNTSAALTALEKGARNDHLSATSYRGVNYQSGTDSSGKPFALGIVGHNAVVGGPTAFRAIIDASHGGSLSSNQSFTGAFGAVDSNAIVRGYVNGPRLASAMSSSPSVANLPSTTRQALLSAVGFGQLRSSSAFALTLKPKTITFEVHSSATSSTSSSNLDVSGLPEGSWLALATGALNPTQLQTLLSLQPSTTGPALNLFRQRYGIDVMNDLLPALGPLQLSIQGTALPALQGGLILAPSNVAAAGRLLGALYNRAKLSTSLSVQGSPSSFTITRAGQPLPRAAVAEVGRRVIATFDESVAQLTAPSSTLSSNPAFGRAKSALPDGTHVSLFLDFTTLGSLTSQIASFQSGGTNYKAQQVIQRLDYLVLGSKPGDSRFVLGMR